MKESPGRYTNPFLSDEENDKANFTTNLDNGELEKSLEPSNVPSESLDKAKEVYIDKNVTECQLPEMITCYEESGFNVVKDICVDEGLSHGELIKCDKEHHNLSCNPIKDDLDTQMISTPLDHDCCNDTSLVSVTEDDNVPSNGVSDEIKLFVESNIGPDNLMKNGEEKLNTSSNSLNDSIRVLEPANNSVDDVDQQLSKAHRAGSEVNEPRETNHTIDIPNEIKVEENNTTLDTDGVKPATVSGPQELSLNMQSPPDHDDVDSKNITRGGGESSFSMACPVTGLITYSGPVTASGSLSHRSDGSNSSVRSFAFPILQNEWNCSPVRMAKVDTKRSRKYRRWRQALMCCRF